MRVESQGDASNRLYTDRGRMGWRMSIALLTTVGILAGCEKARLDREVDRLCAVDGGVHVYETVKLAPENFGKDGEVFPQFRLKPMDRGRFGDEFEYTSKSKVVVEGSPRLIRFEQAISRTKDGKVLGRFVMYARQGGDLPGWHEPSHKTCDQSYWLASLEASVFVRGPSK